MQLTYKKWKCLQIAEMKKNDQKMKFLSNLEIKEQYKKGYEENPELHKKFKKSGIRNVKNRKKNYDKVENFFQQVKKWPLLHFHNMSSKPVSTQCQSV